MRPIARLPLLALLLSASPSLVGCGDSSPSPAPDAASDTAADAAPDTAADAAPDTVADAAPDTVADAAPDTASDTASDTGSDTGSDTALPIDNPWGLPLTAPQTYTVPCQDPLNPGSTTMEASSIHELCTFDDGTATGHVYIEAIPTGCAPAGLSTPPAFGAAQGWMALDGAPGVVELSEASYDWGGNHHNDSLSFRWEGKDYRYYHSSFGFGWRSCQPMDCMQIRDLDGTLLEDGCTKERTLPIVCRPIRSDGTWEPLIDTFAPCEGDFNRP